MTRLIRMELMKLIKRPMTWILLSIQLSVLILGTIVTALSLQNAPSDSIYETMLREIILPDSLANATQFIYQFGVILMTILAASAIGSESNWGTLRQVLATGISRTHFLTTKLLVLAGIALVFVILPLLVMIPISLWVAHIEGQPFTTASFDLAWIIALVGRTYLVVIMPMCLAFLVALIAQSQAVGVGVALGMVIIDQFVSPMLWVLGLDWSLELVQFFPFWCARTLLSLNFTSPPTELPHVMDETRAVVTLMVYTVLCVLAALAIFRQRDVRGAV